MSLEGAPSPLAVAIYRLEVSRTKKFLDDNGCQGNSSFDSLGYELYDLGVGCEIKPMQ